MRTHNSDERNKRSLRIFLGIIVACVLFFAFSDHAHAELSNDGVLDDVVRRFYNVSSRWSGPIIRHAKRLFWFLALTSMVWNFGQMLLKDGLSLTSAVSEVIRFTFFTGLYWTALISSPQIAPAIVRSLRQIGGEATGRGYALSPSGIGDVAFEIFNYSISNTSTWGVADALGALILGLSILVSLALIAINMVCVLCGAWILCYAGIIVLAFGGASWSSNIALDYYKNIFAIGLELMTMSLLVGVGQSFIMDYYRQLSPVVQLLELGILFICSLTLLYLVNKIPTQVAALVSSGAASRSSGSFGAEAAFGAASVAGALVVSGGAAALGFAAEAAGAAEAIKAAVGQATDNVDAGVDLLGSSVGSGSDGSQGDSSGFADAHGTSSTADSSNGSGSSSSSASSSASNPSSPGQNRSGASAGASGSSQKASNDATGPKESNKSAMMAISGAKGQKASQKAEKAQKSGGMERKARIAAETGALLAKGLHSTVISPRIARSLGGRVAIAVRESSIKNSNEEESNLDEKAADAEESNQDTRPNSKNA